MLFSNKTVCKKFGLKKDSKTYRNVKLEGQTLKECMKLARSLFQRHFYNPVKHL